MVEGRAPARVDQVKAGRGKLGKLWVLFQVLCGALKFSKPLSEVVGDFVFDLGQGLHLISS